MSASAGELSSLQRVVSSIPVSIASGWELSLILVKELLAVLMLDIVKLGFSSEDVFEAMVQD